MNESIKHDGSGSAVSLQVHDIINLAMDEFNERLSKYDLSENQLSLIRDIRRRGKNKVAAQNCRKRKLDQIISLADEVKDMKMRKDRFLRDRELAMNERRRVKDKFAALYRHVFQVCLLLIRIDLLSSIFLDFLIAELARCRRQSLLELPIQLAAIG